MSCFVVVCATNRRRLSGLLTSPTEAGARARNHRNNSGHVVQIFRMPCGGGRRSRGGRRRLPTADMLMSDPAHAEAELVRTLDDE